MSALQIVSTGLDADSFKLNEENLTSIINRVPSATKVSVISVVGAFRTGKSFLLNFFLRYLRHKNGDASVDVDLFSEEWMTEEGLELAEGNMNDTNSKKSCDNDDGQSDGTSKASFAWRGGQERQTTGIWMWSEPFIRRIKSSDGSTQEVAILLMDTQGMFDNETSMTLTAQIFGLSTFISSFQVYNVDKRLQEDNLQHLALFSEFGRLALAGNDEPVDIDQGAVGDDKVVTETSSSSGRPEGGEGEESSESMMSKPFQRLQFLIRDWQNFSAELSDEQTNGEKAEALGKLRGEMDAYLSDVLRERALGDLRSTREQITRCFERIDCFMLPHPGPAVTKKTFTGSIDKIEPFFRSMVNQLCRLVFDRELKAKSMNNREITAKELQIYFEVYVRMFQTGNKSFPKAMTMLEATAEANNRNAHYVALSEYKAALGALIGDLSNSPYVNEAAAQATHTAAEKKAVESYNRIATIGSVQSIKKYRESLLSDIEEDRKRYFNLNALRNPFRDIEMYAVPVAVAGSSWFVATLFDIMCTSEVCGVVEDTFKRVYMFVALCLLAAAWKNPFKDIAMYTIPLGVAVSAWFLSTLVDVTCSSETCEKAEDAFEKVYLFIVFSMGALLYKNFKHSANFAQSTIAQIIKEKTN